MWGRNDAVQACGGPATTVTRLAVASAAAMVAGGEGRTGCLRAVDSSYLLGWPAPKRGRVLM